MRRAAMNNKERLTVTVDSEPIEAANQAVAEGRVASLSGWVNLALFERAAKERRRRTLAEAITGYEKEFGEITAPELAAQERTDRHNATVIPRANAGGTHEIRLRHGEDLGKRMANFSHGPVESVR